MKKTAKKKSPEASASTHEKSNPIASDSYNFKRFNLDAFIDSSCRKKFPLSDLLPIKTYSQKDFEVKKCLHLHNGNKIPFLEISDGEFLNIRIYGSHFDSDYHKSLSCLIHNRSKVCPIIDNSLNEYSPVYLRMINCSNSRWSIESHGINELAGDSFKTVFQGFKSDRDLPSVLTAVRELKSEPYKTKLTTNNEGKFELIKADGSDLMNFLRPVIKNSDYKKLKLIEKCMRFLESPTQTKMERTFNSILILCNKLNRPPVPKEIYFNLHPSREEHEYRDIYPDLYDFGLSWLIKNYHK